MENGQKSDKCKQKERDNVIIRSEAKNYETQVKRLKNIPIVYGPYGSEPCRSGGFEKSLMIKQSRF